MSKLETREISKSYRGRKVVDAVTVSVDQGEVVGLLGPNGAGKTTSFYMIVGLISPDSGCILVDNFDVTALPMYQRARRGISYLPQEASVFRKLTVDENLMAILETLPLRGRERRERLDRLVEQLGLEKVRRSQGYMLSGGERRRVEIARSLPGTGAVGESGDYNTVVNAPLRPGDGAKAFREAFESRILPRLADTGRS